MNIELMKKALDTIKRLKIYCKDADPGLVVDLTVIEELESAIAEAQTETTGDLAIARKISKLYRQPYSVDSGNLYWALEVALQHLDMGVKTRTETVYVISETHEQFRSWIHSASPDHKNHYKYVYGVDYLKGISNPTVKFVGTWYNRTDIDDIMLQIKIASR